MLGKFRGKVGATVFRTEAGIGQIASEYNPNPKNPRTMLQTRQRTKMNLAGLISKMTPFEVIAGLGSNGRTARAAFVSNILKKATLSGAGTAAEPLKADVAPADIVFSKGATSDLTITETYYDSNVVAVTFSQPGSTSNTAAVIGIAMVSKNGKLVSIDYASMNIPATGAIPELSIRLSQQMDGEGESVEVFLVPILRSEGAASVMYDVDVDWVNTSYSVSVARSLASVEAYGASKFLGASTWQG